MSAAGGTRLPDTAVSPGRDAPVGGQAVLDGVMMRGIATWAVALRKRPGSGGADGGADPVARAPGAAGSASEEAPVGPIAVQAFPLTSRRTRSRVLRLPVVRGVVALGESLSIGYQALRISTDAQLGTNEEPIPPAVWAGTIVAGLALAVTLFFVIPVALTSLVKDELGSAWLFWLVEGVLRTAIFLVYLTLLSRVRDLRRLFAYHGAEHKVIAAYEAGDQLTPERAQRYPRLHPRCGTSFLLVVMIVAVFVFAPLGLPAWYWLVASRVLGVPLIAGLSFEVIKWAGRNRSKPWVRAVMAPGLALQRLTTREPDLAQLAVAVAALQAVLDEEDPRAAAEEDRVGMEVVA